MRRGLRPDQKKPHMETEPIPNPRRVAAGKRTREMLQRRRAEAARQPVGGNGQSPRKAVDAAWTQYVDDGVDGSADAAALQEAKRALSGSGHTQPIITLLDAVIVVQDALQRGELELAAHDGKPAFYRVTRERVA